MAATAQVLETIDPATGEVIAEVPDASAADVDAAVARAREAFRPAARGARSAPAARAQLLWRIGDLIDRNADELAELETRDQGQPIGISRNVSVAAAAEHFRYYAGWVTKIAGETNPLSFPGTFNYTLREPVGVCGLIIPWNFPLMITAWKLAPALACGNTCVVKPAEQTPLTALRLAELIAEAGIPDGVVEVVTGGPTAGAALAEHPDVDKISFTGSTEVGTLGHQGVRRQLQARLARARRQESRRRLRRRAARGRRRRRAAGRAPQQRTGLRGLQPRLRAPSRRGRVRRGCRRRRRPSMTVGPGLDAATQLGPLVTHEHRESVERYIQAGRRRGRRAPLRRRAPRRRSRGRRVPHAGGVRRRRRRHDGSRARRSSAPSSACCRSTTTTRWWPARTTPPTASAPRSGPATSRARTGSRRPRAPGNVWVNMPNPLDAAAPWGGVKASGWGREMGKDAIDLYTEVKSVWVSLT